LKHQTAPHAQVLGNIKRVTRVASEALFGK
jgi:hypothetical protein